MGRIFLEAIALCAALSTDALVSSFAYGANKIKIPLRSALVIDFTCSLFLCVSLLLGSVIGQYVPPQITKILCCVLLCLIGLIKLFDGIIKTVIKKHSDWSRNVKFSALGLKFILTVYAEPEKADIDNSKTLSVKEAFFLAVALSLDGLAVGFSAGMTGIWWITALMSLGIGLIAVELGCLLGNKVAACAKLDFSWLSGLILIALGIWKLF